MKVRLTIKIQIYLNNTVKALIHLLLYDRLMVRNNLLLTLHQLHDEGVAGASVGFLLFVLFIQALQLFEALLELTGVLLKHRLRLVVLKKNKVT